MKAFISALVLILATTFTPVASAAIDGNDLSGANHTSTRH